MKKNGFTPLDRTQYNLRRSKITNFLCQSFKSRAFRQRYQTGFTLVEMLVVIAIIILISVATVPAITPFLKGQRLSKGARIVQASALAARTMAINSRKTRWLVFDSINHKLSIKDETSSTVLGKEEFLPTNVEFDTTIGTWTVGTSTVSFNPSGSASTTTLGTDTVTIKDKQGNSKNLKIIRYTGQIKSD